jgi:hypothetical protein
MAKLNKRQIIIIAVMALFILYAAYEYLIASPARKKSDQSAKPVEINTFVNEVTADILKNPLAGIDMVIIRRAESDWGKDPFLERTTYKEWATKNTAAGDADSSAKIIYSGYVDAGRKKMAIINGVEYGVGDQLEMEGYVLKSIAPSKVRINNKNTGSELEIPIQE